MFFFKQKTAYEMRSSDWSSDVCSSDLISINAVKQLPAPLHVTVLLDGDLPAGFERLKRATMDMLKDMKGYSSGRLSFSVVDPLDGNVQQQSENTDVLAGHGIMTTNLNVRSEESRVGKEFVSTVGSRG